MGKNNSVKKIDEEQILKRFEYTVQEYIRFYDFYKNQEVSEENTEAFYVMLQTKLMILRKYDYNREDVYLSNVFDAIDKMYPEVGENINILREKFEKLNNYYMEVILSDGTSLNLYKAIEDVMYGLYLHLKCINIWSEMSEDGNRKLALAHQEIADIFFSENNAADALEHYVLAEKFNAEDFYVEVDVLDSVAACLLLLDKPEEGIQKFKELLEILVKYKANDTEAKFQLCNNLFCIIDAESEEEIELREMLMEQIKDEPATVEYVHNFLTNREEK